MKDNCEWLNFQWALDVHYVEQNEAPILRELCRKYGVFWDGENYYKIQGNRVILRWPDWRKKYRIDMEKVRIRNHNSLQKQLLPMVKQR